MQKDIEQIRREIEEANKELIIIRSKLDDTHEKIININLKISDYTMMKDIVYGAIKIVLTAVLLAIVGLVIIKIK